MKRVKGDTEPQNIFLFIIENAVCLLHNERQTRSYEMINDANSSIHILRNSKYYMAFLPKYRMKEFFGGSDRRTFRRLCEWRKAAIHEVEICPDHVPYLAEYVFRDGGIQYHELFERERGPRSLDAV